jgi:hypothetical protein
MLVKHRWAADDGLLKGMLNAALDDLQRGRRCRAGAGRREVGRRRPAGPGHWDFFHLSGAQPASNRCQRECWLDKVAMGTAGPL